MAQAKKTSPTLIKRYVAALLDVAQEKGQLTDLSLQLGELLRMIEGSADLRYTLTTPLFSVAQQQQALGAVLAQARFSSVMSNFVNVVLANRRGRDLRAMLVEAMVELERREGVVSADVTVASPMGETQRQALAQTLGRWSGARVRLNVQVTPALLGGVKVRLGSIQVDDTIVGKLNRLRDVLLNRAARV